MEPLFQKSWKGQQSLEYDATYALRKRKVRVRIKRDAYDFQSYARAEVWYPKEMRWNQVAEVPYPMMESLKASYYSRAEPGRWWSTDETRLLEEAAAILA